MDQNNNPKIWRELLFGKKSSSGYEKYKKISNPQWTAKYGIIFAFVTIAISFIFVLLFGDAGRYVYCSIYDTVPLILGILGTYFSIKRHAGMKLITINILVIFLGILSIIAPAVFMMILGC